MDPVLDPLQIATSFQHVCNSWLQHSEELKQKITDLVARQEELTKEVLQQTASTANGAGTNGYKKKEFMDYVRSNASVARKYYALYSSWFRNFVETVPGLSENERRRAIFWTNQFLNALAPANFFWSNPGAVQRFLETNGVSLSFGLINWLEDVIRGDNLMKIADNTAFQVGKNIAATPGSVIYRNELIELIQYKPATESTYATPVVFIQPWVNKFYIFDLTEQSSFVRYMINHGFTVFIVSWKNPTTEMCTTSFDDYMLKGAIKAMDVTRELCNSPRVHAAGYCIGGTVLAISMAWLNKMWKDASSFPVADWTVFSTLVDYSDAGEIGVFISESAIEFIEFLMKSSGGYLDSKYISQTFRLLRSDSLVWRNFVHNYLYGGTPPKSDMLFWNADSTRLPEAMCSYFLRDLYLRNKLTRKDEAVLGGCPIDLGCIRQPLFAVGAQQDHISPWRSAFQICRLVGCPKRFALTSEGHITGIIDPPSEFSRKKYWIGDVEGGIEPDAWQAGNPEKRGSWWPDWVNWLAKRSGPLGPPPAMGSKKYPLLADAPGTYVFEE